MKTKILMLVVLFGASAVLYAQPKGQDEIRPFHGQKGEMLMERGQAAPLNGLNLTDTQKAAFKQSMLAVQKELQPLRNQLGEAKAHQKTLMTAEKPDLNAINKNIEKIGELKAEMAKIQVKHRLEMRAQLTDEQRLKFDMFKHQMRNGKGLRGPEGRGAMLRGLDHRMN
jgi:Spy/CpxP family protein refolding chaperone